MANSITDITRAYYAAVLGLTDEEIAKKTTGELKTAFFGKGVPHGAPDVVDTFTANGTWTKPAGATWVEIVLISGGGGGGSGRRGAAATTRVGGQGGSSAGVTRYEGLASLLPDVLNVIIGAGGSGGAAVTVDTTNGNTGGNGNTSYVSPEGAVGSQKATLSSYQAGGGVGGGVSGSGFAGAGFPAGGSGAGANGTGGAGNGLNFFAAGCAQGGSGGGITSGDVISAGGAGPLSSRSGALNGQAKGGVAPGGAGTNAEPPLVPGYGHGGAGGASSVTTAGGTGGNASNYGAGGGGGGASLNGFASGAGGRGSQGMVEIKTWL